MVSQERKLLVDFQQVSIGDGTARIGLKCCRESRPLTEFDELFCERRLTGSIHITQGGDDPSQTRMFEGDEPIQVASVFDVKGYGVKEKTISAGLTFALKEIDTGALAKCAKRSGYLVVTEVGFIPDKDDDEDIELDESEFLKSADDESGDAWKLAPLTELELKPGQLKALAAAGAETIGQLEDLRAGGSSGFGRGLIDVKGIGKAAVDDIENRVIAWLDANRDAFGAVAELADKPAQVKLRRSVRGFANQAAGLYKGATFGVLEWVDSDPKVQTLDGESVRLNSDDWEPASLEG